VPRLPCGIKVEDRCDAVTAKISLRGHVGARIPGSSLMWIVRQGKAAMRAGEVSRHGGGAMTKVLFTANIQRHVGCPEAYAAGSTVRDVLEAVFADNPQARSYVLDDQAALRKHMTVFVDGRSIRDRVRLSDTVTESSTIHVFQALSGG
jgi:sulfur-carrier protein